VSIDRGNALHTIALDTRRFVNKLERAGHIEPKPFPPQTVILCHNYKSHLSHDLVRLSGLLSDLRTFRLELLERPDNGIVVEDFSFAFVKSSQQCLLELAETNSKLALSS